MLGWHHWVDFLMVKTLEHVAVWCPVCSIQLDGGNVASSNTCWTDAASTAQPTVVRSALSETALGSVTFGITLQDGNPAVGGTYVGPVTATFVCKYYNPAQLLLPG